MSLPVQFLHVQSDRLCREDALSCAHAFLTFLPDSQRSEVQERPGPWGVIQWGEGERGREGKTAGLTAGAVSSASHRLQKRAGNRQKKPWRVDRRRDSQKTEDMFPVDVRKGQPRLGHLSGDMFCCLQPGLDPPPALLTPVRKADTHISPASGRREQRKQASA